MQIKYDYSNHTSARSSPKTQHKSSRKHPYISHLSSPQACKWLAPRLLSHNTRTKLVQESTPTSKSACRRMRNTANLPFFLAGARERVGWSELSRLCKPAAGDPLRCSVCCFERSWNPKLIDEYDGLSDLSQIL